MRAVRRRYRGRGRRCRQREAQVEVDLLREGLRPSHAILKQRVSSVPPPVSRTRTHRRQNPVEILAAMEYTHGGQLCFWPGIRIWRFGCDCGLPGVNAGQAWCSGARFRPGWRKVNAMLGWQRLAVLAVGTLTLVGCGGNSGSVSHGSSGTSGAAGTNNGAPAEGSTAGRRSDGATGGAPNDGGSDGGPNTRAPNAGAAGVPHTGGKGTGQPESGGSGGAEPPGNADGGTGGRMNGRSGGSPMSDAGDGGTVGAGGTTVPAYGGNAAGAATAAPHAGSAGTDDEARGDGASSGQPGQAGGVGGVAPSAMAGQGGTAGSGAVGQGGTAGASGAAGAPQLVTYPEQCLNIEPAALSSDDCTGVGQAISLFYSNCASRSLGYYWGTQADTAAYWSAHCERALARSGTAWTLQDAIARAGMLAAMPCECRNYWWSEPVFFFGTIANGEGCMENADCASGSCSGSQLNACGTCQPTADVGESCAAQDPPCRFGLFCDVDDVCRSRAEPGASCTGQGQCIASLACMEGICNAPLPLGAPCSDGQCDAELGLCYGGYCTAYWPIPFPGEQCPYGFCSGNAYCDATQSPQTCIARGELGGPCTARADSGSSGTCLAHLVCDLTTGAAGAAGEATGTCVSAPATACE
jgi:hypothetical protein